MGEDLACLQPRSFDARNDARPVHVHIFPRRVMAAPPPALPPVQLSYLRWANVCLARLVRTHHMRLLHRMHQREKRPSSNPSRL